MLSDLKHMINRVLIKHPELKHHTMEEISNIEIEPKWITLARKELGVHEVAGKKTNKIIDNYHKSTGMLNWHDDIPWCGSFVNYIMKKAGYDTPKKPYRALSWLKFGKSSGYPVLGAIAVKKRRGGGHVTFVVGISNDGRYIHCLGGNQNDSVKISTYKTNAFTDFRVPFDYDFDSYHLAKYDAISTKKVKEV